MKDGNYAYAYPFVCKPGRLEEVDYGLTKRELFAAMLMQGIVDHTSMHGPNAIWTARDAVHGADALIAALAEPESK